MHEYESLIQCLHLPAEFGVVILLLALALTVFPYLAGYDFGAIKFPELSSKKKRFLIVLGPIFLALAIFSHVPFFEGCGKTDSDNPSIEDIMQD